MKRVKIILALAVVLLILAALFSRPPAPDPNSPRFVRATTQPSGPFGRENYDWGGAAPFQGGKIWIDAHLGATNWHDFLYDIDNRMVLGELLNGGAIFCNRDQTKIFCEGPPSPITSFKGRVLGFVNAIWSGLNVHTNYVETFWILDLRNNSATRIGNVSQFPGTGSRWQPSPGFRYGYTRPTTSQRDKEFFLCDLELAVFEKIGFNGELEGWWDEHDILTKDSTDNFVLLDILTRKTTTLFSAEYISKFLKENNLPSDPVGVFSSWNGEGYDFYFFSGRVGTTSYRPDSGASFLLKPERAGHSLQLRSKDFHFGYLGAFNEAGTYYVYNGESGPSGQGGNGAVILRDVRKNIERVLIPPDNAGQYALPRLYRESVIYWRSQVYWRIDVNGTNSTRLLPITIDSK